MNFSKKNIYDITASIVLFCSDPDEIMHVIGCFKSTGLRLKMYLIDNSPNDSLKFLGSIEGVEYIYLNKNVGYGAAHNVAISRAKIESTYHAVLNPDISFASSIIDVAYFYMEKNSEVGLLSPRIIFPDGRPQNMCRLLPTPFDLIARRFIPDLLKPLFKKSSQNYLLQGLDFGKTQNIPNLPGSFMFIRTSVFDDVGGFDETFFMYLEDIDLTRRIHTKYKTEFYPEITISHTLEQGSYKSKKLLKYHIRSAINYFNKWGWIVDHERSKVNRLLKKRLNND